MDDMLRMPRVWFMHLWKTCLCRSCQTTQQGLLATKEKQNCNEHSQKIDKKEQVGIRTGKEGNGSCWSSFRMERLQ